MKVIKIEGFRGIITAVFIGICLFAGFVIFPGQVAMFLWNKYLVTLFEFPVLGAAQGVLLWGIIAISYFIISKGGMAISFKSSPSELSESELNMIMKNARIHSGMKRFEKFVQKNDKFIRSNHYDKDLSVNQGENIKSISSIGNDDQDKKLSN